MSNLTKNSPFHQYPIIINDLLPCILYAQGLKLKKTALVASISPLQKPNNDSRCFWPALESALFFDNNSYLLLALEKTYKARRSQKDLLDHIKVFNPAWEKKAKILFKLKALGRRDASSHIISLHDFYANSPPLLQKKFNLALKNSFKNEDFLMSPESLLIIQKFQSLPKNLLLKKKKAEYMRWARERLSVPGHSTYFLRSLISVFTSHGLKKKGYSLVIKGFSYFKQKNKIKLPLTSILDMILLRLRFHFKFKKYNLSRHRTVLLPYPLTEYQRLDNIAAQLKKALTFRKEKTFVLRLSNELEDFFNKKGNLRNLDAQYWKQLNESKNNYRYLKYAKKK